MVYVIAALFIVAGIAMIVFRRRISRAEAGVNAAQFNGRLSGPRWQGYGRSSHLVGGAVAVVVGVLLLIFRGHLHG